MLRRLIAIRTGDHDDQLSSAWWLNRHRNRRRRLTEEQMTNILKRWQ